MASESDQFYTKYENLKIELKQSFDRIYETLKARELATFRQLDLIMKRCQEAKNSKHCINDIKLRLDNESILINNINDYGAIDFENFDMESNILDLKEHIAPNNDHIHSHKELNNERNVFDLKEDTLSHKVKVEHCSCCVHFNREDRRKKINDEQNKHSIKIPNNVDYTIPKIDINSCGCSSDVDSSSVSNKDSDSSNTGPNNEMSEDSEVKKWNPTDDWLNSIKSQTEIEPTYFSDGLEHSDISCL